MPPTWIERGFARKEGVMSSGSSYLTAKQIILKYLSSFKKVMFINNHKRMHFTHIPIHVCFHIYKICISSTKILYSLFAVLFLNILSTNKNSMSSHRMTELRQQVLFFFIIIALSLFTFEFTL